jgi:predicted N-acetyltransferase YhbS
MALAVKKITGGFMNAIAPAWHIRAEEPDDAAEVERLTAAGFGPGRFAKSAWRLREGVTAVRGLSFVAEDGAGLKGSVRFWPIRIGGAPALLLGPLAVQSDQRGLGIGIGLMQAGIAAARARSEEFSAIILVGDAPYYGRVGFTPIPRGQMKFCGPVDYSRLLGLALVDGALERLSGSILRAPLDEPVCADSVPLG